MNSESLIISLPFSLKHSLSKFRFSSHGIFSFAIQSKINSNSVICVMIFIFNISVYYCLTLPSISTITFYHLLIVLMLPPSLSLSHSLTLSHSLSLSRHFHSLTLPLTTTNTNFRHDWPDEIFCLNAFKCRNEPKWAMTPGLGALTAVSQNGQGHNNGLLTWVLKFKYF